MSLGLEIIKNQLEEALNALAEARGEAFAHQIRLILFANLDRGRIQTFLDKGAVSVFDYIKLVAEEYSNLKGLLHSLQVERSDAVWEPLFERMQTWAYNFFLRKNFAAGEETQKTAGGCAAEAAILLLDAYFPYDTDFDAWAHILVQNACRKHIHEAYKKSAIPDENIVELEDELVGSHELLQEVQRPDNELSTEIPEALAQLTEARRRVIEYIFFEGMRAEEAARRMGKSVGAIYSLQFRALEDLRKILSKNKDNSNE